MTIQAYPRERTPGRFTNDDFFPTSVSWALSSTNVYFIINYYFIPGFTPTMTWVLSSDTILEEDCRVCVLWRWSDFYLNRPVLSHQVIYSHTVIQSYKAYIQIYIHTFIHTFMHIYIHTFMHTYIHAYIHSCTYIHTKIIYTQLHRPPWVLIQQNSKKMLYPVWYTLGGRFHKP